MLTVQQYEERQAFAPWAYVVTVGAFLTPLVICVAAPGELADAPLGPWLLPLILLPTMLLILNLLAVVTRVTEEEVYCRLGWLFPVVWKHVRLDTVRGHRKVNYRPLRDAGGWGYRWGRFEGAGCTFMNARGHEGVLLETEKRNIILGSQQAEKLDRALSAVLDKDSGVCRGPRTAH